MKPTIRMDGLSKWYGQVLGVNNITAEIGPGVTGLLGPNGAGKTTLLKILTGQMKSSRGVAQIFDQPVWNNHAVFRHLGFCPDLDTFYDDMTGLEFLIYLVRLHGYRFGEARKMALETLETVSLVHAKNKKIGAYSKGMRQRIKLAQALFHQPEVLILDEPLAGMDPVGRKETIDLIHTYGEAGRTVLVSSHILHEIESMTKRIMLINHGTQIAEGDVHEIRELIQSHPCQVSIVSTDRAVLSNHLVSFPEVVSIRHGESNEELIIETRHPDRFHNRLTDLILAESISIEALSSPDDNLQAVFDYLVE
ncbi:MAG: ABC transporter ATP-binding protein [bacterium]